MIGLEKVTGKIKADAEADARKTLAEADERCAALAAQYKEATDAELERLREASDRECQALVVRARSAAVMAKRNAILEARAAIMNEAYASAERQVRSMHAEQYLELLCKMLRTALKLQMESEEESMRLYGENISPAAYEVLLNPRDFGTYGEKLMKTFKVGLGSKLPVRALSKLSLSTETAEIDGGLILRCGSVEVNCSLATLLAQNRRETEVRVSRILFGEGEL